MDNRKANSYGIMLRKMQTQLFSARLCYAPLMQGSTLSCISRQVLSVRVIGFCLIFFACAVTAAQSKVKLQSPRQQHVEVYLYDEDNDNFLFTLPLTFNMADKNVLVMMIGDDTKCVNGQSVWLFSQDMPLADLIKKNHNVSAAKAFKQRNTELNTVLIQNKKITLYRDFDDGYEVVTKNAKPVFFSITENAAVPLTFYLQFYVAKSDSKYPYIFVAKCKPIEIELINH